jgi:hypothetical protein
MTSHFAPHCRFASTACRPALISKSSTLSIDHLRAFRLIAIFASKFVEAANQSIPGSPATDPSRAWGKRKLKRDE